jgi:hypothetical protein
MRRIFGIVCSVLIGTGALVGQSGGGAGDPISGTWTGAVGPGATPGHAITLTLKFDGAGAISGSAQGPTAGDTGVVKTGTFDPQTGALKMELQIRGGPESATFEGTVVLNTATGQLTISSQPAPGTFILTRRTAASESSSPAPQADTSAVVRHGFTEVSGWILKSAELVPADKYTYQPVKTVRTFGQLVAHIADSHNYDCARAAGKNVQWSDAIEKGRTDKATLLPKLKESIDACTAIYAAGPVPMPLIANLSHSSLHYGNVITYMRMLGLTPPSS